MNLIPLKFLVLLTIALVFPSGKLAAQNNDRRVVTGRIVEAFTHEVVPNVSVCLLSAADSSVITTYQPVGGDTLMLNRFGFFQLPVKEKGKYLIRTSCIGFKTQYTPFEVKYKSALNTGEENDAISILIRRKSPLRKRPGNYRTTRFGIFTVQTVFYGFSDRTVVGIMKQNSKCSGHLDRPNRLNDRSRSTYICKITVFIQTEKIQKFTPVVIKIRVMAVTTNQQNLIKASFERAPLPDEG